MKTNGTMLRVVCWPMLNEIGEAVTWNMNRAVSQSTDLVRVVDRAVTQAVRSDPPHRALLDFLAARRTP